jgi:cytochrome c553
MNSGSGALLIETLVSQKRSRLQTNVAKGITATCLRCHETAQRHQ